MPAPTDGLRFVHAAIVAEANNVEAATKTDDPTELAALAARIATFGHFVDRHTTGEELGLFPKLAERRPSIDATYLFDHVDERVLFAELVDLARDASKGDADALDRLRRQAAVLNEELQAHVRKENELIIPIVEEFFSPPEIGQMVGVMLSVIPPDEMAVVVPWIISLLDPDAAGNYVTMLAGVMPPPAFEAAKGHIKNGVTPERWTELTERVPALV